MRTPLTVTGKDAGKELTAALKQKSLANIHTRIRAVLGVAGGRRIPEVAKVMSIEQRTIRNWVHRYNRFSLAGLHDHRGGKRKCRLSPAQQDALRHRIEAGPLPEDHVCSLRGEDIRRILRQQFTVVYSLPGVYYLLHHKLRMSYLKPRPLHHKADIAQQEAFKKTSLGSWRKFGGNIMVNDLKSGLRMKADSGSRVH